MLRTTLFIIIAFTFVSLSSAQDLSEYIGENRLLILLVDDIELPKYALQIKELHKNTKDVRERKLELVHVTPDAYQVGLYPVLCWEQSKKLYQKFKRPNTTFEVILVGLDGGVKARRTSIFSIEDLFAIIDAMPMRKAEIKNERP